MGKRSDMSAPRDDLEAAITAAAVRALRKRAAALRQRAADGVPVLDRDPVVLVVESKAAHAFRIAHNWDLIAAELEREASS